MKITIYTHDPILNLIYTKEESDELFGEDYIEDYGIEVPDDLAIKVIESYKNLIEAQIEFEKFIKKIK